MDILYFSFLVNTYTEASLGVSQEEASVVALSWERPVPSAVSDARLFSLISAPVGDVAPELRTKHHLNADTIDLLDAICDTPVKVVQQY